MSVQKLGPDRDQMRAGMIPIERIAMHPRNIRTVFTGLEQLADSIRWEGILQPLVAHQKFQRAPHVQDLELLAGHRRLVAAEQAGLRRVPVIVLPRHDDDEAMLAMLAENTQRADVPAADLGRAVKTLHDEFGYGWSAIAERLGISMVELNAWRRGQPAASPSSSRRPRPAARTARRRPATPRIRPTQLHDLCRRWDAGELDPAALVDELRGWLGDWQPTAKPTARAAS